MSNFTKIALVTLFVTNFTLFLGWVPIGVLIPQVLFILYLLVTRPKAFGSKTLVFYYLFFAYQMFYGITGGDEFDMIGWGARFLSIAIPLVISTVLFTPKYLHECRYVSKYALFVSFITVLLSIRVLINDGSALRVTSMANSTGDWDILYGFWRQGMADYAMAAMMLFMPVVLIYKIKSDIKDKKKWLLWGGVIIIVLFMYLGQVTTTFILCLMVSLMAFLNYKDRTLTIVGIGLVALLLVTQLSGILDYAVSVTGGDMSDRFASLSGAVQGEEIEDTSDAGIRWSLISRTISSFISHPLFGSSSALIGGHNYFLDMLAKYGIIGCMPFFLMIRHQYKVISSHFSLEAKRYYIIILVGFITLGIIKNLSGTEYWNYLFIYYPAILVWIDSKKKKQMI